MIRSAPVATAMLFAAGSAFAGDPLPEGLLEQHYSESRCDPLEDLIHGGETAAYPLPDGKTLYMIPCSAGAYNWAYSFYVGENGWFYGLHWADYTDRWGWSGTDVLFLPTFDPESLTLTSFYKGRGLGDCGTWGRWTWDDYAFRLDAFHAKSACDGEGDVGEFPQVYP